MKHRLASLALHVLIFLVSLPLLILYVPQPAQMILSFMLGFAVTTSYLNKR